MKKLVILFLLLIACSKAVEHPVPQPVRIIEAPVPAVEQAPATPVPTPPSLSCSDSDGGKNVFVKGTVKNQLDSMTDVCLAVKKEGELISIPSGVEYFCENGNIVAEVVACEHGCENGACLSAPRPVYSLTKDAKCEEGLVIQNAVKITKCHSSCLSQTMCDPQGGKTQHLTLPWQLNCVVPSNAVVTNNWVEFDVLRPVKVEFSAYVKGSEIVSVKIHDSGGNLVAGVISQRAASSNRCFADVRGSARVQLEPGSYEVRISAQGTAPDNMRSFQGKELSVSFLQSS
jgi:hypothetical protein